jgi:exopolysaccharide biosynthesis WecB/TagA/CpsF family protein
MSNQVKILNCFIDNIKKTELLDNFTKGVLVPVNVDMLVKMQFDEEFYRSCHHGAFRINDSQIIKRASRFLGVPIIETIQGSDFFPLFYTFHQSNEKVTIFLLGAMPGIAEKAMKNINNKVNRKMVIGCYSPPFGFEKDAQECKKIVALINHSKATVLAVGLGAPKQEKWVFKYLNEFIHVKRTLCIGATIDFEAGIIKKAPKIFKKVGFEWCFRLLLEPRRLWKRYLVDDIPFLWLIVLQKFNKYRNPFQEVAR